VVSVGQLTSAQIENSVRISLTMNVRVLTTRLYRRVLFLGYSSGFQMWDCTNLASVSEVLNLSAPSWGHVTFAGALPPPVADDIQFSSLRPLIGLM